VIAIAGVRLHGQGRQLVLKWRELAVQNRLNVLLDSIYRSTTRNKLTHLVVPILATVIGSTLKNRIQNLDDFVITLDALLEHDARDILAHIQVPVLIVGGAEDVFYPAETLKDLF